MAKHKHYPKKFRMKLERMREERAARSDAERMREERATLSDYDPNTAPHGREFGRMSVLWHEFPMKSSTHFIHARFADPPRIHFHMRFQLFAEPRLPHIVVAPPWDTEGASL